jgi:hypothetical protein
MQDGDELAESRYVGREARFLELNATIPSGSISSSRKLQAAGSSVQTEKWGAGMGSRNASREQGCAFQFNAMETLATAISSRATVHCCSAQAQVNFECTASIVIGQCRAIQTVEFMTAGRSALRMRLA